MKYFTVKLNDIYPNVVSENYSASLDCYIPDNLKEIDIDMKRPAVLICPGGGYRFVSPREGEPVALKFIAEGYNAFVLSYSVTTDESPARFPTAALQAFMAIAYMRQKAKEHNTDTNKVICCGFSAGGHLAGTTGCLFDNKEYITSAFNPDVSLRPDGLILCYPVITAGEKTHQGSFNNLIGNQRSPLHKLLSLENSVSGSAPPVFIWHTQDDALVPVENTLLFAAALKKHKIKHKTIIYKSGVHGLSLATNLTAPKNNPALINKSAAKWFSSAITFFQNIIFKNSK